MIRVEKASEAALNWAAATYLGDIWYGDTSTPKPTDLFKVRRNGTSPQVLFIRGGSPIYNPCSNWYYAGTLLSQYGINLLKITPNTWRATHASSPDPDGDSFSISYEHNIPTTAICMCFVALKKGDMFQVDPRLFVTPAVIEEVNQAEERFRAAEDELFEEVAREELEASMAMVRREFEIERAEARQAASRADRMFISSRGWVRAEDI